MLHDKLYWFIIILLSLPLFLFLGVHVSSINILLTEPVLVIASVLIKIFNITDEGVVFIAKHAQMGFYIYSVFLVLLSSLFAILVTKSENDDNKRPWKYPFIVVIEILFIILVITGLNYYKKISYQKAVRSHLISNNLIQNIKATNVADLAYDRNILNITFNPLRTNPALNKLIIEMTIRDKKGNVIGYTAIKAIRSGNVWKYKDMIFDKQLKIINGQVKTQTVLYEDKTVLARIISVTVKDSNPVSRTFNKTLVAKDVVIQYEKNPFLK